MAKGAFEAHSSSHLVVRSLRQAEVGEAPPRTESEGRCEQPQLGARALTAREALYQLQLGVEPREGEGAEHPEDPHEVVKARAEVPLER